MTNEHTLTAPYRLLSRWRIIPQLLIVLAMVLALISLGGCRTAQIRDLDYQPVPPGLSAAQVSKTIQSAGNSLGWAMKQTRPGMIEGTLFVRDHMAKVEIPYSKNSYSIRYVSSTNLKYDASKRTIHSNYSSWIQNLDNQIRARLASL